MPATIRKGSRGNDVKQWQTAIKALPIDGIFGAGTETATKKWQQSHGLAADGIVGPKTWATVPGGGTTPAPQAARPAPAPQPARPASSGYVPSPAYPAQPAARPAITPTVTNVRPAPAPAPVARPAANAARPASPTLSFIQPSAQPTQAQVPTSVSIQTPSGSISATNAPPQTAKPSWLSVPKNRQILLFGGLGAIVAGTALYFIAFRHKGGSQQMQGYPRYPQFPSPQPQQTRAPDYLQYQSLAQRPQTEGR